MKATGVILGSTSVAVCGLERSGGDWIATGGATADGNSADAIRQAFELAGLKRGKVAISAHDPNEVVRRIRVPSMGDDELAESISWEAEQYVPYDLSEFSIGFQRLAEGGSEVDVALYGNRLEVIRGVAARVRQAGCKPVRWLPGSLCAPSWYELAEGAPVDSCLLVELGAVATRVTRFSNGRFSTRRQIDVGAAQIERVLRERGLDGAIDARDAGPYRGADTAGMVRAAIAGEVAAIAGEIARVAAFFEAVDGLPVERIDAIGWPSHLGELVPAIGRACGVPATIWRRAADLGAELVAAAGLASGRYAAIPV